MQQSSAAVEWGPAQESLAQGLEGQSPKATHLQKKAFDAHLSLRGKNALTIDFEDCLCNEYLLKYIPESLDRKAVQGQVIEATDRLLKLLEKYDTKATFFVLGKVAENCPEYVKMLHESGHEISSHGYSHTVLYKLGKGGFEEELKRSTRLIKSITHEQPLGFRAPSFSLDQSTAWVYPLLEKYGYAYDSSIYPMRIMLYGVPKAPLVPYRPDLNDITRNDDSRPIIEFPLSVVKFWKNIPVSGGFYLRFFPSWFMDLSIGRISKSRPAIIYIHPWETYQKTIRVKAPLLSRFEAYHGINSSLHKLESLLQKYRFMPVRDVLSL